MRIKTLIAAFVLSLAPGFALAEGCGFGHSDQMTMSCAQGTSWDADSQSCVPIATS